MKKIWSFGLAMLDVVTQPVHQWPETGGAEITETTDLVIGGMALNTAATLAKLGRVDVGLIASIGDDVGGRVLKSELQALGVDLQRLSVSENNPTGVAICCVHPGGERSMFLCFGANNELSLKTANLDGLQAGDIFHVGGSMCIEKTSGGYLAAILQKVKEQGLLTSVDTMWDGTGKWWSLLEPCLPYTDILLTNDDEARRYAECENLDDAAGKFMQHGAEMVIIKAGEQGATVYSETWRGHVDILPVESRDATGAGDAFAGGFLLGLAHGWDVRQAALFGSAVGAECVTAYGATTGIKSYAETIAFIHEHNRAGDWNWELD
ncbi:MAG: carbohydrate kinase family protein [Anaerolineales bacterium]|nr:carbohydrate kinase family protein [Anaerolineales bacterium]